jgi:hypothetical protein
MQRGVNEQIRQITSAIDHHIAVLRDHGLNQAALMLGMAQLDLLATVNSISDDEFAEFCRALERRAADGGKKSLPLARRRCGAAPRSPRQGLLDRRSQLLDRERLG